MLVLGYRKMLNNQGLTHSLKYLISVVVQGCGLLSPERTQPSSRGGTACDVQGRCSHPCPECLALPTSSLAGGAAGPFTLICYPGMSALLQFGQMTASLGKTHFLKLLLM